MHIPDGFLNLPTAGLCGGLAAAGVGTALWQAKRELQASRVPFLGVTAAFVFAAQMLNFPVAAGTSGHLVGGVLAAVLLGPSAAVVVMSSVLILQCFLFQDGGATALGANIFNMAVAGVVVGWVVFSVVRRFSVDLRGITLGAVFAGWCSTVVAAVCCAAELALSGRAPWGAVLAAMAGVHMIIGVGEGTITALVLLAIAKARPELLDVCTGRSDSRATASKQRGVVALGLIAAIGLAALVAPFACRWPDGLEKVAAKLGFEHFALDESMVPVPMPDYELRGLDAWWVVPLVGTVGTVAAFAFAWVVARILVPKKGN